ncbi:NAD(P)H-binding protein [Nakamurella sp. YIM 132087]|uniref:NAD(P)H-binding protein n=1 Tax=Nakamurella alba TaxID=2665158 RepID=A0A7K1FND5_9ACTN|nr:NAD(P)H-binding protein [Nakamurella alba]MTD15675.1 NAD(P)H-binding protein [Nakamurella alba]
MPVLVMGATGNTGAAVTGALRAQGIEVLAVSRRAQEWPSGVRGVVADVNDPDGLRSAARDATGAYLLSGYPAEAGLLDSLPADAPVVLLSSSSVALDPERARSNPVAGYHLGSEEAVRASGHPWTILRPNSFMANALRWLPQLRDGDVVRGQFGDIPVAVVDPDDIGAVAAAAFADPSVHAARTYRLSGPAALTPAEQVRILGEGIGRSLRFEGWDDEQARTEMGRDMPAEYVDAFFGIFRGGLADETTVQPDVGRVLGRPPATFAGWVARHAAEFRRPV